MSTDQPSSGPDDPFAGRPQEPGASGGSSGSPYDWQSPPGYPGSSPYDAELGAPEPPTGMPPLADRGRRLLARIVDGLIIGIPVYAITGAAWGGYDYQNTGEAFWQSVIYAVVYLIYQVFMLSRDGQSLGKKLMRIRVAMLEDGSTPNSQAALSREAVYALVPIVPCCGTIFWFINVLWCTWDKPYQQCLHDKVAKTVVARTG